MIKPFPMPFLQGSCVKPGFHPIASRLRAVSRFLQILSEGSARAWSFACLARFDRRTTPKQRGCS